MVTPRPSPPFLARTICAHERKGTWNAETKSADDDVSPSGIPLLTFFWLPLRCVIPSGARELTFVASDPWTETRGGRGGEG